ncbi:hypothetical protein D918_09943 [Trichuris suis]|nr:hypothetical protein D918_09943 [Trichuris suis]
MANSYTPGWNDPPALPTPSGLTRCVSSRSLLSRRAFFSAGSPGGQILDSRSEGDVIELSNGEIVSVLWECLKSCEELSARFEAYVHSWMAGVTAIILECQKQHGNCVRGVQRMRLVQVLLYRHKNSFDQYRFWQVEKTRGPSRSKQTGSGVT